MDTTGTIGTVNNLCVHKLPCGICRLTMAQCLKEPYMITTMWGTQDICVKTTTGSMTTNEGEE